MTGSGQSSKTIAIIVAIVVITIALMGADAWKQSQRGRKPAAVPAAAVSGTQTGTPAPVAAQPKQPRHGQDPGTPDEHGEIMMNE